jgi:hypothetical protein
MRTDCAFCTPADAEEPAVEDDSPADTLVDELQAELAEMRGIVLGSARRMQARAEVDDSTDGLAKLNTGITKAARAFRQIAVLQLEIAGKRKLPGTREPAAAAQAAPGAAAPGAAAKGAAAKGKIERSARWNAADRSYPFDHGDYTDYDDYTDWEHDRLGEAILDERRKRVVAAMDADFRAAGRDEVLGQAPVTKFKMILDLPHPALDACLPTIEPEIVLYFFRKDVRLALGPGPPGIWEKHDAYRKQFGLDKR